jgi:hypothetical protein
VWFLGGTFTVFEFQPGAVVGVAERSCSVPHGKALFFPIVNAECNTIEDPNDTEDKLRVFANDLADHIGNLHAAIDGEDLTNISRYRVESPPFTFGPLPPNNVPGKMEGSTADSVSDGVYLMLAPLSSGQHDIHFSGEAVFTTPEDGFDFTFQLDITYHVTVE